MERVVEEDMRRWGTDWAVDVGLAELEELGVDWGEADLCVSGSTTAFPCTLGIPPTLTGHAPRTAMTYPTRAC